ncbi:MAG: amidohydrolase [Desulfobacterales bacterium]
MSVISQSLVFALAALLVGGSQAVAESDSKGPADTVYRNGFVYTVDATRSRAEAFAVKDGKYIAIGKNEDMKAVTGSDTKVVNLKGRMVMPGLVDTHIHAVRGALTALGVSFPAESTLEEIKTAVKQYIADKQLKKGEWVQGAKWALDYKTLNAKMLDEVAPDNPVMLHDWTNHLIWVNSAALKAAGIDKNTPNPVAGVIDRDSEGNPTGTLHDKALGLVTAVIPAPKPEVMEERAAWIFNRLNQYGITAITTPQLDPARIAAYRSLESKGKLTLRIQGSWDFNTRYVTTTLEEQAKTFMTRDKRGPNSPLINVDGVKIYLDGIPNDAEGGAPMIDAYATAPSFGTPSIDESTLSTWFLRFDKEGLKVMGHSTGSLSVRHYLNALEATRRANGKGPRHHMAHSMLVYPDEIERFNFVRSNFVAEVSPYQLWTPDPAMGPWARWIGRDRFNLTITPIRTLVEAGALVAYGSDWDNVAEPDTWFALEGMITRQMPGKPELGNVTLGQRIDRETAIEIFTRNGAMLMETEDETGTMEPGKSADFIVINQNILEVPVEKIHETKVLQTVLQGKTVYER